MYVCMYVCMHACMHACMYVCMYVCMYACMYVCMYVYVCMCMYVPGSRWPSAFARATVRPCLNDKMAFAPNLCDRKRMHTPHQFTFGHVAFAGIGSCFCFARTRFFGAFGFCFWRRLGRLCRQWRTIVSVWIFSTRRFVLHLLGAVGSTFSDICFGDAAVPVSTDVDFDGAGFDLPDISCTTQRGTLGAPLFRPRRTPLRLAARLISFFLATGFGCVSGTETGSGEVTAGAGAFESSTFWVFETVGDFSGAVCSGTAADGADSDGTDSDGAALAFACPISSNNHAGVFGLFLQCIQNNKNC